VCKAEESAHRGGLFFLAPHPVDLIESERKKKKLGRAVPFGSSSPAPLHLSFGGGGEQACGESYFFN